MIAIPEHALAQISVSITLAPPALPVYEQPLLVEELFLVAARYNDEYVRQDGQWKFSKMSLVPYFMVPLKEGWAQADRLKMRTH